MAAGRAKTDAPADDASAQPELVKDRGGKVLMVHRVWRDACPAGTAMSTLAVTLKIVAVEDQSLLRDMLVMSCGKVAPGAEAHGVATLAEAIALSRTVQPELIILDLALPDGDALDSIDRLRDAARSAKIIVLTSHTDEFTLHRALRARVHGFVDKDQAFDVLKEAIATVMAGRRYLSPAAQQVYLAMSTDPLDFSRVLSDREQGLMGYFGAGFSNEEIAVKVGISESTIKRHRANIMNKLNLHSAAQLMVYAVEKGFTRVHHRRHQPVGGAMPPK